MAVLSSRLETLLDAGDTSGAVSLCEAAHVAEPGCTAALRHLGVLYALQGRRSEALHAARQACELSAGDPQAWSDRGRVHALLDDLPAAIRCFHLAVSLDVCYADGWHNLGTALRQQGQFTAAFTALKNALLIDPGRAVTYMNLANLLIDNDQLEDALECFERAANHDPTLASARSRLAEQLAVNGKLERAESLFRQSLTLDTGHVDGWLGLGRTLEDIGDADGALACYRNVLNRYPAHARALGHMLALQREDVTSDLLSLAHNHLNDPERPDEARALIGYGLAKYHDRRSEFEHAARAGVAANAARRRATQPLDQAALAERVDGLIATYDEDFFARCRRFGMGTDQPVFIVGLPRSGTTLTEQIIAAHPLLHGGGERADLPRLAARVAASREHRPWQAAADLDLMSSRAVAQAYLAALRDGAPKERLRISDKAPLNFFQLAFAATLFPHARVIHCTRDMHDNALSIWLENFNPDQHYATDFADLAFFAAQYRRLMQHWRQVLPLEMLEVRYEDTVADVAGQARRIVEFLGVPWDVRCLDFHRHDRAVQTPSRWQVRQPIYTQSVERWRNYAEHLPALGNAFDAGLKIAPRC